MEGESFYCSVSCCLFTLVPRRCLFSPARNPKYNNPPRQEGSDSTAVKASSSHRRHGCGRTTVVGARLGPSASMSCIWVCTGVGLLRSCIIVGVPPQSTVTEDYLDRVSCELCLIVFFLFISLSNLAVCSPSNSDRSPTMASGPRPCNTTLSERVKFVVVFFSFV